MARKSSIWLITGIAVMVLTVGLVGIALAHNIEAAQPLQRTFTDKIEDTLITELSAGPADFIVRFAEQPDLTPAYQMNWEARGVYVYNTLEEVSARSQVDAKEILASRSMRYQTFIAGNELYVWAGNLDAAQALAALPEVAYIRETHVYELLPIEKNTSSTSEVRWAGDLLAYHLESTARDPAAPAETAWGIVDTNADEFWSAFGVQGDAIVVANIDTGVDYTHDALDQNYKCSANPSDPACWLDPGTADCYDPDGGPCDSWTGIYHGTHVMGTQAGDDDPTLDYQVGMAPSSQWIACLGCPNGGCPEFDLNTCADWLLAPGGDPANRPHVVNNSWGGWGGDTFYLAKVEAWRAAGIFPAFAAGNDGPYCSTLGSPGDYQESFGSAAHDSGRSIADFSSRGPSYFGHDPYTKPNISAPGVSVLSAMPGDGWQWMSGTSMASPHTAGAVALLWSCNPGLVGQIDQTFEILQTTADLPPDGNCGAPDDGEGNYTYGYGYLNVYASGLLWCGETGTLEGNVYDFSMNPINLAHVYSTPGTYETSTDASGFYQMNMMVGTYTVTAEAFGYYPSSVLVNIVTDTVTLQDFALEAAPSAIISGTVTDATTGWPLYASIEIAGYPYGTIWTDPVTGFYSVSLPQGSSYEFTVNAWVPGYLPETRWVGPFYGDATENFALSADMDACTAPGYEILYAEDFEADDGGFSTYEEPGYSNSWEWGAPSPDPYPGPYPGPGEAHSGANAWATNLDGNYYDYEDSYIESPDIDLSSLVGQWFDLSWWQWLLTEGCCDFADIQVSSDGGMSWSTVYGPVSGWIDTEWSQHIITLDPVFAVGNFRVRFHMLSNDYYTEAGWYLDDLSIGTCQPQEGGLVVGNVYESNLGNPLTGAEVSNDSGEATVTAYTDDPNLGDSFYVLFSPSGLHDFTASYPGYNTVTDAVDVVSGSTVGHDFYLPAGHLTLEPASLETTLDLGVTQTLPMTLTNDGDGTAYFEIREKDAGFIPAMQALGPFATPVLLVSTEQANAVTTEGLELPPAPQAAILDAGDVLQSWYPSQNGSPWGIAFDGSNDSVWVGDGWGAPYIYEYAPDGIPTGRSHEYDWGIYNGPADDAFNWNTGMLWTLDVAQDDCLHEMDPASGYTGNTICGPWYYSQRGLAYDPASDTWFVGSWNDYTIYHIDSAGNLLDSAYVGLAISGLAYNPATLHLFVMVNDWDEMVYVLDAANNYQIIGQFYIDGWPGAYNGAGLEMDCEGNLWAVAQGYWTVYQFESGETASLCEPGWDAPWLNEIPQEGTVFADSTYEVELGFTAFPSMTIGSSYTATLILQSDDPVSDTYRVPVTMTVIAPLIEVSMNPAEMTQSSPPGTVVNYLLTIRNDGNVPDTYDLTLEGRDWPALLQGDLPYIKPGEEAEVSIFVFIPSTAQDGEMDVMTVRATSTESDLVSATTQLTTVAMYQRLPRLTPPTATTIGDIGGMVEVTLTLWNFSVVSDTIDLSVDSDWVVDLPFTSYTLDSYEYVEFTVQVYIPVSASQGDMEEVVITATSQSDPLAWDASSLFTYAGLGRTYLPMVEK